MQWPSAYGWTTPRMTSIKGEISFIDSCVYSCRRDGSRIPNPFYPMLYSMSNNCHTFPGERVLEMFHFLLPVRPAFPNAVSCQVLISSPFISHHLWKSDFHYNGAWSSHVCSARPERLFKVPSEIVACDWTRFLVTVFIQNVCPECQHSSGKAWHWTGSCYDGSLMCAVQSKMAIKVAHLIFFFLTYDTCWMVLSARLTQISSLFSPNTGTKTQNMTSLKVLRTQEAFFPVVLS